MNQPEALRLADELDAVITPYCLESKAAAELRRLHARLIACEDIAERAIAGCARLSAQRDALLEALRKIAAIGNKMWGTDWEEIDEAREIARAAIAKTEEQT